MHWRSAIPKNMFVRGLLLGLVPLIVYGVYVQLQEASENACLTKYQYTSPTIDCAYYNESSDKLQALDAQLEQASAVYVSEGKAAKVSVWARDLDSTTFAASGENTNYAPASLLKLPLMIAFYKLAELDPSILQKSIRDNLTTDYNAQEHFSTTSPLVAGTAYTVEDLIELMIRNSDNNATVLLYGNIDQGFFTQTLVDLGLTVPAGTSTLNFVTVKNYSNIFRTLYDASYLSRDYSEKALEIMAEPSDLVGISYGLPASANVADKFGERTYTDTNGTTVHELHDCGIVYTDHPYTLCVMTEGASFDDLLSVIRGLSAITYKALGPDQL